MTRALVTGSTGCLGSNLVAALNARGVEVVGLRRSTSPDDATYDLDMIPAIGDVLDIDSLRAALDGVDWVFHVAAVATYRKTPDDLFYRVNVEGTRNVLRAAQEAGVKRFVLTSSVGALGRPRPGKALMDEEDTFNLKPADFPYGHSKHLAEEVLAGFAAQGFPALSVLPSVLLGPRDVKIIGGEIIFQALKGSVPALPHGTANYIDVRDCAEGHIAAAERGLPGERYLLTGHNLIHHEVMAIIHGVLGTRIPRYTIPHWLLRPLAEGAGVADRLGIDLPIDRGRLLLSGDCMCYDNGKAVHELGLRIRPFAETVRDTYQWYRDHGYLEKRGLAPLPKCPVCADQVGNCRC
jgi:dihydroflavonol-4-reductase